MNDLYDRTFDELAAWAGENGLPAYRTAQVFRWLGRGVTTFDAMTDLSKDLRATLATSVSSAWARRCLTVRASATGASWAPTPS